MKRLIALLTVIAACFAAGLQPAFAGDSADGGEKTAARAAAQAKAPAVKLSVSPASRTYSSSGWTGCSIAVKANVPWKASSSVSWITLTRTSGSGNGSVGFRVKQNTGTSARTGRITVSTKGKSVSCTIKQNAKPITLQTAVTSRKHPASGVTGMTLGVKANVPWRATSSVSWIRLTRSSGSGSGSLAYNVTENTGTSERTGTITVSGGGKTAKCKITQHKKVIKLQTAVTSRKHPASGVSGMSLKVTANVPWTASSSVSWIKLTRSSGNGNGVLVYNVPENTGAGERTGKITVSAKGKTATCTITQHKKTKLAISATGRSFTSAAASGKLLGVTANVKWTAKSSASWLKLSKSSGNGNGNVAYGVTANTGVARTGTITVSGGGLSRTFTVSQGGKTPALSLAASSRTFTADAASGKLLDVTANMPWKASSSVSWIKLSKSSGNGNGNVAYGVTANTGTSSRTGTITVSGGGLWRTFTVTQNGRAAPKANLRFYKPSGWPAAMFVTTYETYTSTRTSFTANSTPVVCVRWAWDNNGDAVAAAHKVRFAVSGAASHVTTLSSSSLNTSYYRTLHRYYGQADSAGSIYAAPSKAGVYTVTVTLDSWDEVAEKNESDNTASVTFTVLSLRSAKNGTAGESSSSETAAGAPEEADGGGEPADADLDDGDWVVVTTSDQIDGGVLLDGDEGTGWGPVGEGGGWVVLSYSEPIDVKNVAVKGEGLPEEGVRVLLSEDADEWLEGTEGRARYVWVLLPEEAAGATVTEIEVEEAE